VRRMNRLIGIILALVLMATASAQTTHVNNLQADGNINANGTVTGSNIPATISGTGTCVNQFVRVLNNGLPPTCNTVNLAADVTGVLPNSNIPNPVTSSLNPTGTTGLPASAGSPGWLVQGPFPTALAFYCGDGTGFNCKFFSRNASVNTTLLTINDFAPNLVPATLSVPGLTTLTTLNTASYLFVDQIAGADFCAKMTACDTALLASGGGVCNALALTGAQACAGTWTEGTNQVRHLLGDVTVGCTQNPCVNWSANGSTIEGASWNDTIFSTNSGTADIIKVTAAGAANHFSQFKVTSSVVRSAGVGLHVQGGNNTFEKIWVEPVWDGINLDTISTGGDNLFDKMIFQGGGSGAAFHCGISNGGVPTGTVASNSFTNILSISNGPAYSDAFFCMKDGSDSIHLDNIEAAWGGSDSVQLHFEQVAAGNPPSNIKINSSTFEGGVTKTPIVIDSVQGVDFSNATAQSGLIGMLVNAGTRITWTGGLFYLNQDEGVRLTGLSTNGHLTINGARFGNNSQAANNTFSDFFAAANIGNFSILNSTFAISNGAPANLPKANVEITAGTANNYTVTGNSYANSVGAAVLNGGTGTNQLICSAGLPCKSISFVAGDGGTSATSYGEASDPTTGMFFAAGSGILWSVGNATKGFLTASDFRLGSGHSFGFSSNVSPGAAGLDTNLSRISAGLFGVGTGAQGSFAGGIKESLHVFGETTAPAAGATTDVCYGDSTAHALECSYNNGAFSPVVRNLDLLSPPPIGTTTPNSIKATTITETNLLLSNAAPTISSGFGTTPSIVQPNGTAAFEINVGTGGTATSGVIGLPTATNGWNCTCQDKTTFSATVNYCRQTADSTTTATIGNFNSTFVAAAWVASDILYLRCFAR